MVGRRQQLAATAVELGGLVAEAPVEDPRIGDRGEGRRAMGAKLVSPRNLQMISELDQEQACDGSIGGSDVQRSLTLSGGCRGDHLVAEPNDFTVRQRRLTQPAKPNQQDHRANPEAWLD